MTINEKIQAHFAGVTTYDISISEQKAHNRLVSRVRRTTYQMLEYQAKKIRVEYDR